MLYALKIASRYLLSSKAQSALLVLGVALGVFIFIFMSALIGGLANYILASIAGDLSHVSIIAEVEDPALLLDQNSGHILLAQEKSALRQAFLRDAAIYVPMIAALPGVVAVSPQITGSGFITRGGQVAQVAINGVEPGKESAIVQLKSYIVAGSVGLGTGLTLIGQTLADDLDLKVGDTIRLDSAQGVSALLTVSGIYKIGQGGFDRATAYVSLDTARTLMALPQGVTRIDIKLADLMAADAAALRVSAITGLKAKSWTEQGAQVMSALAAQRQTGLLLKSFAMVSIVIGIASSLLLSTYRRKAEIGIMRAMGASRRFVVFVFVSQGALVGLVGGVMGAGLGYLVLQAFPPRDAAHPSVMPIDIHEGAFGLAILLTITIATLAAILPARSAARVDPVTAIGQ
ncbi:ABC transporter permease [Cypionkella sinensis]|uniref:ABC transporter permease n=1 Tax=Cypionkella sinensis TaxID=1756043 RepID=A0ABV7IVI8_9RHOB